jgi:type IV secretion system protein VirB9
MQKLIISSVLVLSGLSTGIAMAASNPHRIAADSHIKVVQYDPNNVVLLNGQYGYQTQITFAPNEVVQNVSLGDSIAWQAVPVGNNLFIKPVASSKTNMTVLTNANSYNFQLDSQQQDGTPTYKLQFVYSQGGFNSNGQSNAVATFDPDKLNWKYSYTGDASIAPISMFDNGQFTFFKFKDGGGSRMPSVFIVDQHRNETLVNYHMQGGYLVVNSVAKQFTLRDGETVATVYNNLAIGDWNKV